MSDFSDKLLNWYDVNARELPWRIPPADRKRGVMPDPYRVWLSEIMLQQTTIPHGIRYFLRFTELWPDVQSLASADRDDIMREWAGLGYYARARNLYACAKAIVENGGFPETADRLIRFPGIGPYTAGAIAAIAFDQPAIAVDGNVERVFARQIALDKPVRDAKGDIRDAVLAELPNQRSGDFAQALMDLGATVCTPRSPDCGACPVAHSCQAQMFGSAEAYPVKAPKTPKPERFGDVFIFNDGKFVRVERRPETGLLAGMVGLPTTDWADAAQERKDDAAKTFIGEVTHVFTHFRLTLKVYDVPEAEIETSQRVKITELHDAGLPSVFAKAVKLWASKRAG